MEPSELQGELRNDGRSVHHRSELEKTFAVIAAKLEALKHEIDFRDPSTSLGMTDRLDEVGGS